ncbi:MAG: hypothetical protein LBR11_00210 [Deltaproteobacteria bacterium]|jgi:hypothetical protein|nr:hypothetical protein [Deltaproteobacteria bacterium]
MSNISLQIDNILQQRKQRLPSINDILARCRDMQKPLQLVDEAIAQISDPLDSKDPLKEVCNFCHESIYNFQSELTDLSVNIQRNLGRFQRETINIGFAGTKGMGKSFLLQNLSGLSENEVPTGDGMPVTAVRCTINNSIENNAKILFFDDDGFINNRLRPFFSTLGLPVPDSLKDFRLMKLPSACQDDKEEIYRQKLEKIQEQIDVFSPYLKGREEVVPLDNLRRFVSYSVPNNDRPGGLEPSYIYLAVSSVIINCSFPRSDVNKLQLIDLPGLGELDPTLEQRHTEGFQDNVDVCLFIRRPSGTRMDWDQEAQKALEVLTRNTPFSKPSDFVLFVLNAGGCKHDNAQIMLEEIKNKLGGRYKILSTTSSDSDGLSNDVLINVLMHLANKLPEADSEIYTKLNEKLRLILESIRSFTDKVRQDLKIRGKGQDSEEVIRHAAKDAKRSFAFTCSDLLKELEVKSQSNKELEGLSDELDVIEKNIQNYYDNGFNAGSKEAWFKNTRNSLAENIGFGGVLEREVNKMRVKIAESFSSLETLYKLRADEVRGRVIDAFNQEDVLNNLLTGQDVECKLQCFLDYIDNADMPIPKMRNAVETILKLRIDHDTQFYPRAYEPIRSLKNAVSARGFTLDGSNTMEVAESLYCHLRDLGDKTTSDISRLLISETRQVFNILYVAFEYFEDLIVRNEDAEDEWIRFFKEYFDDIRPGDRKSNQSYLLNKALKLIDDLRELTL